MKTTERSSGAPTRPPAATIEKSSAVPLLERAKTLRENGDLEAALNAANEATRSTSGLQEAIQASVALVNIGVASFQEAEAEMPGLQTKISALQAEINQTKALAGMAWKVDELVEKIKPLRKQLADLNDLHRRGLGSAHAGLRTLGSYAQGEATDGLTTWAAQWAAQVKAAEAEDLEKARAEAEEARRELEAFKAALEEANQLLEAHRALGIKGRLAPDLDFVQERVEAAQTASTSHEVKAAACQAIAWLHGRFDHERGERRIGNACEALGYIFNALEDIIARRKYMAGDDPDADKAISFFNSAVVEFNQGQFKSNVRAEKGSNFYTARINRLLNPPKRNEEYYHGRPGQQRRGHDQRRRQRRN